jgi:hypothetical protein
LDHDRLPARQGSWPPGDRCVFACIPGKSAWSERHPQASDFGRLGSGWMPGHCPAWESAKQTDPKPDGLGLLPGRQTSLGAESRTKHAQSFTAVTQDWRAFRIVLLLLNFLSFCRFSCFSPCFLYRSFSLLQLCNSFSPLFICLYVFLQQYEFPLLFCLLNKEVLPWSALQGDVTGAVMLGLEQKWMDLSAWTWDLQR